MSVSTRTTCVTEGGDSSAVQDQLFDVHHIQATESAFAAIRGDGVVVCWGNPQDGGDCTDAQEKLIDVKHVQATTKAFAAIRADKTVVTWGSGSCDLDGHIPVTQLLFPIFPNSSGFVGKKGVGCFLVPGMVLFLLQPYPAHSSRMFNPRWWRQQRSARPAEERGAHPGSVIGFCRIEIGWISGNLGDLRCGWRQQLCSRSAS